jgi:hypothetical protein
MSSESVCLVARIWVDVGNFHTRLSGVVYVTCANFRDGSEKGTATVQQQFLAKHKMAVIPHPPYSPDLVP